MNKKKTANAERGMAGFGNYLSKIKGVAPAPDSLDVAEEIKEKVAAPRDFRGRMEDKLKELKQK